jgi:transcriptional regulator with XRE-family HTH domain
MDELEARHSRPSPHSRRRVALGDFLRSRRERLTPDQVGLTGGPRRRTPGLRREEVALLSGVSVSWYSWLEQGRRIGVSRQVLDALALTLRLTAAERRHLFELAGEAETGEAPVGEGCPAVGDHLRETVAALAPNPACLLDRHWDILAWNDAEAALYDGFGELTPGRRNMIWLYYGWQPMRSMIKDWETEAWAVLAQFRASADRHPGDPRFAQIVADVSSADPAFAGRWERHDVAGFTPALKRFDHPRLGPLTFRQTKLIAAEDSELHLVARFPADPATRDALHGPS